MSLSLAKCFGLGLLMATPCLAKQGSSARKDDVKDDLLDPTAVAGYQSAVDAGSNLQWCEDLLLLDGRTPVHFPDTWGEARETFRTLCEKDELSVGEDADCSAAMTKVFEGYPLDTTRFELESQLCERLFGRAARAQGDGASRQVLKRRLKTGGSAGAGGGYMSGTTYASRSMMAPAFVGLYLMSSNRRRYGTYGDQDDDDCLMKDSAAVEVQCLDSMGGDQNICFDCIACETDACVQALTGCEEFIHLSYTECDEYEPDIGAIIGTVFGVLVFCFICIKCYKIQKKWRENQITSTDGYINNSPVVLGSVIPARKSVDLQ